MRNEPTIPPVEELKEFGITLKEDKKTGNTDAYGWPHEPPGGLSASALLRYRIARALIGYTTASGRKVKKYGIHLIIGLFILSMFVYGASRTPYFFDAMATYVGMSIFFFILFTYVYNRPNYGSIIQEVRKGEEIPIAVEDDNGKTKVITTKAAETFTNVFRMEVEAMENLIPFGVIQEKSANNSPVWKIKHYHYNMVWGSAMYESYDTTHMDSWGEIISWMPDDVEDAIKRTEKYLKRDKLPEEEIAFVKGKIQDIYRAMQFINYNETEINTRYGRKIVQIKRTKKNKAFFTAWNEIVNDIEKYHLERLQNRAAANKQEKTIVQLMNNMREAEIERVYDRDRMQERIKSAFDEGYVMRDMLFHSPDQLVHEQDTAARSDDLRKTEDIGKIAIKNSIEKQIEESINGTTDETR